MTARRLLEDGGAALRIDGAQPQHLGVDPAGAAQERVALAVESARLAEEPVGGALLFLAARDQRLGRLLVPVPRGDLLGGAPVQLLGAAGVGGAGAPGEVPRRRGAPPVHLVADARIHALRLGAILLRLGAQLGDAGALRIGGLARLAAVGLVVARLVLQGLGLLLEAVPLPRVVLAAGGVAQALCRGMLVARRRVLAGAVGVGVVHARREEGGVALGALGAVPELLGLDATLVADERVAVVVEPLGLGEIAVGGALLVVGLADEREGAVVVTLGLAAFAGRLPAQGFGALEVGIGSGRWRRWRC